MTETITDEMTADAALVCALDCVEQALRESGWSQDEDGEWSLTFGRHSVLAIAEEVAQRDGRVGILLEATTGFLPWKRRARHRQIDL